MAWRSAAARPVPRASSPAWSRIHARIDASRTLHKLTTWNVAPASTSARRIHTLHHRTALPATPVSGAHPLDLRSGPLDIRESGFQERLAIERRPHELMEALETNGDLRSTAAHRSSGATSALSVQ